MVPRPDGSTRTRRGQWRGQGLVEYGLILALSSLLTVVWLVLFEGAIAEALAAIGGAIDAATGG
jgi:Flp pilus assembly pilin Flp